MKLSSSSQNYFCIYKKVTYSVIGDGATILFDKKFTDFKVTSICSVMQRGPKVLRWKDEKLFALYIYIYDSFAWNLMQREIWNYTIFRKPGNIFPCNELLRFVCSSSILLQQINKHVTWLDIKKSKDFFFYHPNILQILSKVWKEVFWKECDPSEMDNKHIKRIMR